MFEKAKSANSLSFARNGCLFMWGAYFCMGAYECDVVVVIKVGAYINFYPDIMVLHLSWFTEMFVKECFMNTIAVHLALTYMAVYYHLS